MTICQDLLEHEQEWRKHSVHPLRDDSDRDFEFYVFVDPEDTGKRPLFLQVLAQAITDANAELQGEPLQQFKEWTGTDDKSLATAINWIKIAIEQYPMRLFVARDEVPDRQLHPFLKKRICWLSRQEFESSLGKKERFTLWLHAQWVKHLIRDVRADLQSKDFSILWFEFLELTTHDAGYLPPTLPDCLKGSMLKANVQPGFYLCLDNLSFCQQPATEAIPIKFRRHTNIWRWNVNRGWELEIEPPPEYGESFSGVLSYGGRLIEAATGGDEHRRFLLSFAEAGLLRLGIADERFQEWWERQDMEDLGNLLLQKIIPVLWEKENEYGQRGFSGNKPYVKYTPPETCKQCQEGGVDFFALQAPCPWAEQHHSLDLLVVHQGILDKWRQGASKQDFTKAVLAWKSHFPWVVVTSGRGRPEATPRGVKFLPFAGIEACIVSRYFEKLTLIRQITVIIEEVEER